MDTAARASAVQHRRARRLFQARSRSSCLTDTCRSLIRSGTANGVPCVLLVNSAPDPAGYPTARIRVSGDARPSLRRSTRL